MTSSRCDDCAILRHWLKHGLSKPGKSKGGLARALGRSNSVVSKILNGTREIKARELPLIAAYLGELVPPYETRFPHPRKPPKRSPPSQAPSQSRGCL